VCSSDLPAGRTGLGKKGEITDNDLPINWSPLAPRETGQLGAGSACESTENAMAHDMDVLTEGSMRANIQRTLSVTF